jgi:hypothetical protein
MARIEKTTTGGIDAALSLDARDYHCSASGYSLTLHAPRH